MEGWKEMLGRMMGKENQKFEAVATLSKEQKDEWNACQRLMQDAELMLEEGKARKDLLWSRIRRALPIDVRDRETLKIENGVLWASVDEPKEQSVGELPQLPQE
jgi:hypothetical protein